MKNLKSGLQFSLLLMLVLACTSEEPTVTLSEISTVEVNSNELKEKDTPSSRETSELVVEFCDCDYKNCDPEFTNYPCDGEDNVARLQALGIIRSNPCRIISGCYPNGILIDDLILTLPAIKPDASISIVTASGELFASPLKEFGGRSSFDEKNLQKTFAFGVVNKNLSQERLYFKINTQYIDEQKNVGIFEGLVDLDKGYIRL